MDSILPEFDKNNFNKATKQKILKTKAELENKRINSYKLLKNQRLSTKYCFIRPLVLIELVINRPRHFVPPPKKGDFGDILS